MSEIKVGDRVRYVGKDGNSRSWVFDWVTFDFMGEVGTVARVGGDRGVTQDGNHGYDPTGLVVQFDNPHLNGWSVAAYPVEEFEIIG